MLTLSKIPLSGSTHGRGIEVTTTAPIDGSDTAVHTGQASTTLTDWVTLYAYNDHTTDTLDLHLGWGGTTDPDDFIIVPVPPQEGLLLVVPGLPIRNSLAVVASASGTGIVLYGFVMREVES